MGETGRDAGVCCNMMEGKVTHRNGADVLAALFEGMIRGIVYVVSESNKS